MSMGQIVKDSTIFDESTKPENTEPGAPNSKSSKLPKATEPAPPAIEEIAPDADSNTESTADGDGAPLDSSSSPLLVGGGSSPKAADEAQNGTIPLPLIALIVPVVLLIGASMIHRRKKESEEA